MKGFPLIKELDVLARVASQGKEIKGIQIQKEEIQSSLFVDDMILYVENSKDLKKTVRSNKFSNIAGYINIKISCIPIH